MPPRRRAAAARRPHHRSGARSSRTSSSSADRCASRSRSFGLLTAVLVTVALFSSGLLAALWWYRFGPEASGRILEELSQVGGAGTGTRRTV